MGDSLFSLFAKAIRANNRRETFEATLGDGRNNLNTARTNYVYARVSLPTGVTLTEVLCTRVPKVYGNQVLVAYNVENVLEVIGYSTVKADGYLSNMPLSTTGQHAWTHQFERGTDKLFVDMRAVGGLQTLPLDTPAQAVYVTPYFYQISATDYRYFAGGTVDLSSYFPTGLNQQRPVLVGLNVVTGSTQVVTGTIDNFTGLTRSQMPYGGANVAQITGSTNFYPSAALRLFSSDVVQHYDIFLNMRQWGEFGGIVPLTRGGAGRDVSAFQGYVFYNNGSAYEVMIVGAQPSAPTVNDDADDGFIVGSEWYTATSAYKCVDNTVGAAVWVEFGGSGGSMSSFTLAGDTGIPAVIGDGETVTIAGSGGLTTVISGNTVYVDLPSDTVSNAKLANMAAFTVKANATSGSANPTDVAFSADNQFFGRRAGALVATTLVAADIPSLAASIITSGQLALARGGTGADLSATGGANQLVRQNSIGGAFTVSALTQADIPTNAIDNTRLADMAALTVKVRASNSSGDPSDLAFSADGQFLVRRSSALTVGTIVSADLTTALTTPPAIGGTTPAAGSFTTITGAGNLLVSGAGYEIQLSAPAGNYRNFRYMSTISGTPTNRWNLAANFTAESGSNAGSDFAIRAFDDSGNFLVQPILITRATGNILFSSDIEIDGALNHDGTTMGFYGATPITKPTITGSRQVNEALQSLLDALESMGLITDSTTA